MSKFDFLTEEHLDVEDFMAKHKSYANLKSDELDYISDDEIVTAVTAWVEGKFDEGWTNMCEVINGLPTPCLNLYCADYVTKEVMNGGFAQAFFNSSRDYIGAAAEGFRAIGYNEAADIIEQALKINFDSNKKITGRSLEDFIEYSSNGEYEDTDSAFYEIFSDKKFSGLAKTFILKYRKYFGEHNN